MNSFGHILRLTSFGESHGKAIGGVLDGFPAGIMIDAEFVQQYLDRRKPGQSELTTARREEDTVQFLSGIFENTSTGSPIAFLIPNADQRSGDYDTLKNIYRPSHADYTYAQKYGLRDHRGGGRSSARETAVRVTAGALVIHWLRRQGIRFYAYVKQVYTIAVPVPYAELELENVYASSVRCPHAETAARMEEAILQAKAEGDSLGGIIELVVRNVPAGLGSPVYAKLHAELGAALLSVNAVKGVEFGSGFDSVQYKGSELNDAFYATDEGAVKTRTNHSGGIQGGISNGEDIVVRIAFKPTATIARKQATVDTAGNDTEIEAAGRHDPCVLPRAVPIIEAMAALVIADHLLWNRTVKNTY